MTIPPNIHFCWIGRSLPWAYVFAVLSAAERSGLAQVTLNHTDQLADGPELRALRRAPVVHLRAIEPSDCLGEVGAMLGVGDALASLYDRIETPVMRSDLLRAAILYRDGGIYLDLDTVTVATLRPLLDAAQFVGTEFVVWPSAVRNSRSPLVWLRHATLDLARKLCRASPDGWRHFRLIENLYVRSINNAVIGARPRSPLLADYLRAMLDIPAARRRRRYALGPDLLGDIIARTRPRDLVVHAPRVFHPLPPEISEHWFRQRASTVSDILPVETRVVHWYASVRTQARVDRITPDYIRQHRDTQLYSMLVHRCLRHLPDAA